MHGLKKTAIAICLQSDDPGMFNHLIFHYLLKDLGRGDIHIIRPLRGDPVFNYKLKDIEKGINIGQLDIIIKFKEVDNPLLYVGFLQQVDSLSYADTAIDKLNEYGINTILIPIGLWAEVPFHMPRRFLYLATHEELSEKLKEYSMHPMHGIIRDDFFMDVL
ncbi:MAG: hypothetical protein NZM04_02430, partial [Methylacidiphilales bacterium]|nr:hypothetical protein [Candidatus Methylacidiphilales bacterium]